RPRPRAGTRSTSSAPRGARSPSRPSSRPRSSSPRAWSRSRSPRRRAETPRTTAARTARRSSRRSPRSRGGPSIRSATRSASGSGIAPTLSRRRSARRPRPTSNGSSADELDVLPRLKAGDSYAARSCDQVRSAGSCFGRDSARKRASDVPSTGVFGLRASRGDHDVRGGVVVPIQYRPAVLALPLPDRQRLLAADDPADGAGAGGRRESVLAHHRPASFAGLLLDQPDQGSPAGVVDRTGQARAREARDRERLQADHLVLVDDPGGELVMVVKTGVRDRLVDAGDLQARVEIG